MATFDDNKIKQELEEQQPNDENIMRPENLEMFTDIISSQDVPTAIHTVKNFLELEDCVELNIGVTGESGSGKSKFVNAFRGLGDEEKGSATTGVVETTMKPQVYCHPKYRNVKVWDLPGIGTPNFKANEYLRQVQFECYDFFIIIASDRFRENHTQLANEIKNMEKKFYFVRSMVDNAVNGEKHKKNFDLEEILNHIRKYCKEGLKNTGIGAPDVFLISSFELDKYDFNLLQERMEKDLSEHKRHVLMLAVPNITRKVNEKKKKALEENIFRVALLSACVAAVPLPGLSVSVDLAIIKKEIEKYYSAFGLDDPSLQMLCAKYGKTIEELKNVMKSPLHLGINPTSVLSLVSTASLYVSESAVEYYCSLIPVLGTVIAGGMSYVTVLNVLKKALNELAEDARNVLLAAVQTEV